MTCIAPEAPGVRCPQSPEPGSLFCRKHEQAPGVQRGGWLSAERRRRQRAGGLSAGQFDASNITPRLWMSGLPPADSDLPGFDVMALCAEAESRFHGAVLRCPLPSSLSVYDVRAALLTAQRVASSLRGGHTVLVACQTGQEASALVTGLALGMVTRWTPKDIVGRIRRRRAAGCLSNPQYMHVLEFYLGRR